MLSNFYDKTFTVNRMVWSVGSNRGSSLSEVGTFQGYLQQASQELVERFAMNFQTSFSIWCDIGTDVKIGDTLEEGNSVYTVRAIQINNTGNHPHLQLGVEGGVFESDES